MELQTYEECMENKDLFVVLDGHRSGRFIYEFKNGDGDFCFYWFDDSVYHRLDGPAYINNMWREWWFLGERVYVYSQAEFEQWLSSKL